jgi:mRNA interferase RelE/StbE
MKFKILIHREAVKVLKGLDKKSKRRIKDNLNVLEEDPYHKRSSADIRRLTGTNPVLYRMRVGDYRVIYAIEGDIVLITDIFHRSKAYLRV